MKRNVVCLNETEESSSACREEEKPEQIKTCVQPTCQPKYIWFTSEWGEVSSPVYLIEYTAQHLQF